MPNAVQDFTKHILNALGWQVMRVRPGFVSVRVPTDYDPEQGFFLHKYVKDDGSFDYDQYRRVQEEGNKAKIDRVFVQQANIEFIAGYMRERIGQPKFGLCHGTRQGLEQKWFRDALGCEVIGTEISETGTQYPHTIRWDFHNAKPEWINQVDFIYSNSLDHSYDPEQCLRTWISCLRPGGLCFLEHTSEHEPQKATRLDPFGVELVRLPFLITKWARGQFGVRDIVKAPALKNRLTFSYIVVIQRFADDWSRFASSNTNLETHEREKSTVQDGSERR